MDEFFTYLGNVIANNTTLDLQRRIIYSFVLLVVLWVLYKRAQRRVACHLDGENRQYQWQKGLSHPAVLRRPHGRKNRPGGMNTGALKICWGW